jgi:hypothetical protein
MYAARHHILRRLDNHIQAHGSLNVDRLKGSLEGMRLVALQKQIQAPMRVPGTDNEGEVRVPLVPPASLILNGPKSSFADVIAPYMLLQAKHTSDVAVAVALGQELDKCYLLKNRKDDRVLLGLLALWKGDLAITETRESGQVHILHQNSSAYPENLVKFGTPSDVFVYAPTESIRTAISLAGRSLDLPELGELEELGKKVTLRLFWIPTPPPSAYRMWG